MFHVSTDCTTTSSPALSASQGNSPFFPATTTTDKSLDLKKSIIKTTLERLFTECKTPYQTALPYDIELHDLCLAEGAARRYPIRTPSGALDDTIDADRYLRAGVVLASAAYGYLPQRHQVYIALYTMWIVWFDDRYADADDIDGVEEFSERFMSRREQKTRGLEMMADLLRRVGEFWPGAIQGNIVLVSTLKYVTGGLLEDKINRKALAVSASSKSFSGWLRSFTGVAEAYAMFIFPPELEIWKYMQAIQDICDWINGYNDTVSYYKEEKAGEANNYVSLEAAALGVDKLFVLNRLTNDTVTYNERVEGILSAHPDALHFFEMFKRGDLLFHSSMEKRYHLGELFL